MKKLLLIAAIFAAQANAEEFPDQMKVGNAQNGLTCKLFSSEGVYFCEDNQPTDGAASNTLILSLDEIKDIGGKPVVPVVAYLIN
jgi:hypothetical protein